jgi:hypothetical protein
MAWNREHAGVAAAPAVAIDWSVIAMTEAAGRLAVAGAWDLHRVAAAVGETVWWVTLVDATLVRYHPRDYETALASKEVRRRKTAPPSATTAQAAGRGARCPSPGSKRSLRGRGSGS